MINLWLMISNCEKWLDIALIVGIFCHLNKLTSSAIFLIISSSSKFYFQQNTTMEQYQEKENTL